MRTSSQLSLDLAGSADDVPAYDLIRVPKVQTSANDTTDIDVTELDEVLALEKEITIAFPKPIRMRDRNYLNWIRRRPCIACARKAEAHHVVSRGAGGSDYQTVPLCAKCHGELHQFGRLHFEVKHRIDLVREGQSLLEKYSAVAPIRSAAARKRCARVAVECGR